MIVPSRKISIIVSKVARNSGPVQLLQPAESDITKADTVSQLPEEQGGITCGTIDEPRKSSKAIDERVIIDFRDKNVIIARFSDKNGGFLFYR